MEAVMDKFLFIKKQVLDKIIFIKTLLVCNKQVLDLECCQLSYHIYIITGTDVYKRQDTDSEYLRSSVNVHFDVRHYSS